MYDRHRPHDVPTMTSKPPVTKPTAATQPYRYRACEQTFCDETCPYRRTRNKRAAETPYVSLCAGSQL